MASLPPHPVRIQLLMGPAVPFAAPREVVDALLDVTVESGSGDAQSGFQLTFTLSHRSPLHTLFLLSGGAGIPVLRVVVSVVVGGITDVLVDGVMTHHEVQPAGAGTSTLVVRGKDLTALMDVVALDGLPYPAMPPSARALAALAKYAVLGVTPTVVPSVMEDIPLPTDRIPQHQGTDYAYLGALARDVGHVFYLEPGPRPGASTAYWGPQLRTGTPQPALNADFDGPHTNVTALTFRFDKEAKELPVVYIQEPTSKAPVLVTVPDVTPLNPPLGLVPPLPPRITYLKDTAKLNPLAAAMRGLAYASTHSDSVFGSGALDVTRYGRVLKSRRLVGVRGAGEAFDGLHYVTSVTSVLRRGSFTQTFQLARNALLSTVPGVPA